MTGNDVAVLLGFLAAAIALTGFAGIVTSIDRSAAVASNEVISFRVRNLVTSAVASVFLSLLPILLEGLELFKSSLWQRCCVVSAICIGAFLFSLVSARLRLTGGKVAGLSHSLFAANLTPSARSHSVSLPRVPTEPLPGAALTSRGSFTCCISRARCSIAWWPWRTRPPGSRRKRSSDARPATALLRGFMSDAEYRRDNATVPATCDCSRAANRTLSGQVARLLLVRLPFGQGPAARLSRLAGRPRTMNDRAGELRPRSRPTFWPANRGSAFARTSSVWPDDRHDAAPVVGAQSYGSGAPVGCSASPRASSRAKPSA